ncbi:MAG: hypothetical protein IKW01_04225 [Firmicutes bacterium]|nr:hypothetical protein [Bacillota bacterium]
MMKTLYDVDEKKADVMEEPELFEWVDFKYEDPAQNAMESETDEPEPEPEEKKNDKTQPKSIGDEERHNILESVLRERIQQVEQHLEKTKRETEIIHESARNKGFEEGRKSGHEAGFAEGFEEGKAEGYSDMQKRIVELEELFEDFLADAEIEKQKMLERYMEDLKEIALVIGEKIVRTSLRTDSNVIERMIVAATEKLKKSAWAKIYVDSSEVGRSIQADPRFLRELSYLSEQIKIVMMDGMEPGTCIIERPGEIIDISVGTQLENIREIMNNARV